MRIAIIGANGQIGSDLAAAARSRGLNVLPLTHADCEVVKRPTPMYEQRLRFFQILRLESFGEPVVHGRERVVGFPNPPLVAHEARIAGRSAQLP